MSTGGVEVPETLLIGMTRGQWPLEVFYTPSQAADWLARGSDAADRRVVRVKLEIVEELVRVPPVPARLESRPVQRAADGA